MPTPRPLPAKAVIVGRGDTLQEVAARVAVTPGLFRRVLNGQAPTWPALRRRLAADLHLPEELLFGDTDSPEFIPSAIAAMKTAGIEIDGETIVDPTALGALAANLPAGGR